MPAWLARSDYSPVLIVLTGLLAFAGYCGLGRQLLALARCPLDEPWETVTAALLGLMLSFAATMTVAVLGVASNAALVAILFVVWMSGAFEISRRLLRRASTASFHEHASRYSRTIIALVVIAAATNLIIACAPSTKFDEVFYHMLVPGRIVHDGALRFYSLPWQAAVIPQLGFQIASAPFHAIGLPDAPNVVSWCYSGALAWFAFRLVRNAGHGLDRSGVCALLIIAGLYASVWHVTGGGHAFGDLASAALVVAVILPEAIPPPVANDARALMLGIFGASAAMTRVMLLPLCVILVVLGMVWIARGLKTRDVIRLSAIATIPALLSLGFAAAWTWHASGAPFGPLFSWFFPSSVYAGTAIREALGRWGSIPAQEVVLRYSPLLWMGVFGALVFSSLPIRRRALMGVLLFGQVTLVLVVQGFEPRYLGGLPYAFVIFATLAPSGQLERAWRSRALPVMTAALVVPWVAVSLYYSAPFARVVSGFETAQSFRERFVSYYDEYEALDLVLPENAVLLTSASTSLSSAYAPRFPVWSSQDIPPTAHAFQFDKTCGSNDSSMVATDTVFFTPLAKSLVYRNPRRSPERSPLCVTRLVPKSPSAPPSR